MAHSVWKGNIAFGLVSFPVQLSVAARGESLSFNQLHKGDLSRLKQVMFCTTEDRMVTKEEIVKGYEYEKGKYVVIEPGDIEKVKPKSGSVMEIIEFVKADTVDPVYLESSYYVTPQNSGAKPYALLCEGMRAAGYFAIAKVTMHSREHVVIIRPGARGGMTLHTMFFHNEVRLADEFRSDASLLSEKELKLAGMLIESLAMDFQPDKYVDTYRMNLEGMIQAKIEGREITEIRAPKAAEVFNIMDALERSLIERKPAKAAAAEPTPISIVAEPKKRKKSA